jgi:beta-mannosidase
VVEKAPEGDVVRVHLVSDLPQPVVGKLTVQTLTFRGVRRFQQLVNVVVPAAGSTLALEVPVADALGGLDPGEVVLVATFEAARGGGVAEHLLYFALPKQLALTDPQLGLEVRRQGREWLVDVSASALARAVELVAPAANGRFEDNFFDLLPGESRTVRFLPDGAPPERLQVWVRSLYRGQ